MTIKSTLCATALAVGAFAGAPASAATLGGGNCAADLSFTGSSSLLACYGRFTGNANNNASNADINQALIALGYMGAPVVFSTVPAANSLGFSGSGNTALNFPGVFNGTVFLGIHAGSGVGNTTSFYKINAVNLDSFTFIPNGFSNATVYATLQAPVPEPSAWALMILGFGAVGFAMRAKRLQRVRFAI